MQALSSLGFFFLTVAVGLLVLTVLVYVHELGHYLFAKRYGMHVNAFAIFMGGVRKTDLTPWLRKPMVPSVLLWGVFVLGFIAAAIGAIMANDVLYLSGLSVAGILVPVWSMLRLAVLYHVPPTVPLGTLGKGVLIALVVVAFGTKFRGVDAQMIVGVLAGAAIISLIFTYYLPINMKEQDEDKQGYGQIDVLNSTIFSHAEGDLPVKDGEKVETVPVRFRPVWSKVGKGGTEFSLLLLPLGGFAQIGGMHPKADGSEVKIDGGFYSKPPLKRLMVLFAGPMFSILFGLLLLFGLFTTSGKEIPDTQPIVGGVSKGSGAETAGIQKGDRIVSIDGAPIATFHDLTTEMRDKWRAGADGKNEPIPVSVVISRNGEEQTLTVVPMVDEEPMPLRDENMEFIDEKAIQARLGVLYETVHVNLSPVEAAQEAIEAPVAMVAGLAKVATQPSTAKDQVAGPTAMAEVTSAAVRSGLYTVVWYAAVLSISLGVMNLLPIVPLDGGQMLVAFVELLRGGRRLSLKMQNILTSSGFVLLAVMMLAVFSVDLGRTAKENQRADTTSSAPPTPEVK